jgi:hypothetical protein
MSKFLHGPPKFSRGPPVGDRSPSAPHQKPFSVNLLGYGDVYKFTDVSENSTASNPIVVLAAF